MMNELLLQHIWQHKYLLHHKLSTTTGEALEIINPGTLNTNQGPDFFNAKIKIGNTVWAGNIEIHLKSSHWFEHKHHLDESYNNVILHVVYEHNIPVTNTKNQIIQTLALKPYLSEKLIATYHTLQEKKGKIPCESIFKLPEPIKLKSWLNRLMVERLEHKSNEIFGLLQESNNSWEETFYKIICKYFGQKVNNEAFLQLARILPLSVLAKHKHNLLQLQSLLLGCAGFLQQKPDDEYLFSLYREFNFLKHKLNLQCLPSHIWKFARTRPANFPTLRLFQLAELIYRSTNLFSKMYESKNVQEIAGWLQIKTTQKLLYSQLVQNSKSKKSLSLNTGKTFTDSLIINAIVPAVFSYGKYKNIDAYQDKAIDWLEALCYEKNNITGLFANLGISIKTALESQALIELKNNYCNAKKCLDCVIGNAIIFSENEI